MFLKKTMTFDDKLIKFRKRHLISELLHKQMLPFLEYGLSETDNENFDCEK